MTKHDTLNAVAVFVGFYFLFAMFVLAFPLSWFEKSVLCGFLAVGVLFGGLWYFYMKKDLAIDERKVNRLFSGRYLLLMCLDSGIIGFGMGSFVFYFSGNSTLFPEMPQINLIVAVCCFAIAITLAMYVWRRIGKVPR
jgi:hypothetical protein